MSTEKLLKVENIYKKYGNEEVLKGVSFEMNQAETKVIIGPSGTGKSTLLRCINQLTKPDQGRVWLEGEEVTDGSKDINRFRQNIGMVFQHFNLFEHLTALGNVTLGLRKVKGLNRIRQKVSVTKNWKGLDYPIKQSPIRLSFPVGRNKGWE